VSASEKLRALDYVHERVRNGTSEKPVAHVLLDALPQIAVVVEAAEREVGMEEDTEEARARQIPRLRQALAALDEALS
jgi:hypothetical protein